MDALIQELGIKYSSMAACNCEQVRRCLVKIIELADQDALDILRFRVVEQEVLDLIDEPKT